MIRAQNYRGISTLPENDGLGLNIKRSGGYCGNCIICVLCLREAQCTSQDASV